MEKLKPEDEKTLEAFTLRCVKQNAKFSVLTNKVAISPIATIQELIHDTRMDTLETFVQKLEDLERTQGASRLKKDKVYLSGDVTASDLADILVIILKIKAAKAADESRRRELLKLNAEIEGLETPQERKLKLMERKAELLKEAE